MAFSVRQSLQYEAAPPPSALDAPPPAALAALAARPAGAPGAAAARRRCIFISYAHEDGAQDGDPPRIFYQELRRLCEDHPQHGVHPDDIFFDRHGLLPGTRWSDEIARALAASEIVFFLVSSHSLNSSYCIEQEVGAALAAGKCLVPVVLTDCRWADRVVPAGPQRFRLGDFQAVPKDHIRLRPVELWQHRSSAWRAVIEQVQALLAATPVPPRPLPAAAASGLPGLLPFKCNQTTLVQRFRLQLRPWKTQALLVLLRGVYDDELHSLMRRLADEELARRCDDAGLKVLQPAELKTWPTDEDPQLAEFVHAELSLALTGDDARITDAAGLAQALAALPGLQPLLLNAPKAGPALGQSLQAALALLESAPADAPLHRLALVLTLEDEALLAEADLAGALGLRGHARTHVVELARVQALQDDDVAKWFDDHGLHQHFDEGRPAFVQRVFDGRAELRMRPFAQAARRLLPLR